MKSYSIYLLPFLFVFGLGSSNIVLGQKAGVKEMKYMVVINHEEQYSIWPAKKKTKNKWKTTGVSGNLSHCQAHIEEVWTDMRPLSVRKMKLSKNAEYQVVINHEEQYSIWPLKLPPPRKWKATGTKGSLSKCQRHIEGVWTDMRPLSLRN